MMHKKRGPQHINVPSAWSKEFISKNYRGYRPPVVISFYDRYDHLYRLLQSLKSCHEIELYDIFVFQDAHSYSAHGQNHQRIFFDEIKNYKKNISLHISLRERNLGLLLNSTEMISSAIEVADSCIFLEDDLEVSSGFLEFMSEGIEYALENYTDVVGVNGYMPPIQKFSPAKEVTPVLTKRWHGWGVGHIGHHWRRFTWPNLQDYKLLTDNYASEINEELGLDVWNMIRGVCFGVLDAGDVAVWFYSIMNNLDLVSPSFSLVRNHGFDGSGMHCFETDRFDIDNLPAQFKFNWDKVNKSPQIQKKCVEFRNKGFDLAVVNKQ